MTLASFFRKRRIATLDELEEALDLSGRSVLRQLKTVGYYSSYTHNSRFYTLKHIPKFNRDLVWMHKEVGFTKLNNLFDLIVHSIERSPSGYTAAELSERIHTRVTNQLRILSRGYRVRRVRFSYAHVYFSLTPSQFQRQFSRRKKKSGEAPLVEPHIVRSARLPGGLSHHEIVMILTMMINYPRHSLKKLRADLRSAGVDISDAAIRDLVDTYGLQRYKKKEHRILTLALDHLAAERGQRRWDDPSKILPFAPQQETCPDCDEQLEVLKTQDQTVYSVLYGNFTAKVYYTYCSDHEYPPGDFSTVQSYRSEVLAKVVGRYRRYAYDVMTYIGISRYIQAQQVGEICSELRSEYKIPISRAQTGRLSEEFLIRLSCLHESYRFHLKRLIQSQGGYFLHIDASCENKSSTVLVGLDSVTGWVLLSEKIPSEREEFIAPALKRLRRSFGKPTGVMRDMAQALENAVTAAFPGVRQRICHYHFLKDVGKDILRDDYQALRAGIIREKVGPQLNSLRRDLLEPLKSHNPNQQLLEDILAGKRKFSRKIYQSVDLLVLVTTVDWIMKYPQDGSGLGFPFDHSYVYLYERCQRVFHLLLRLQKCVSSTQFKDARLDTLVLALAKVCDLAYESARDLKEIATAHAVKLSEFNRLRRVMRFYCDRKAPLAQDLGYSSIAEMRMANKKLREYLQRAKTRRRNLRHPERHEALTIIVTHLENHWDYLMVDARRRTVYGPRTNNDDEGVHRDSKRKIRRATGKKDISREFDRLGAYMPLVRNLESSSYVEAVVGSIDNLPEAFAGLDPELVAKHTEQFYEAQYGPAYRLRKTVNPISLLGTLEPKT